MIDLDLRFNGPVPKYLGHMHSAPPLSIRHKIEEIYRIKQMKKHQLKKRFVYPSKNNPISQHEKNLETKGQI